MKTHISKKVRRDVLTQAGLDALKLELLELEGTRKSAVDELVWARDMGDRSENAAYKSARRKLSGIDSRIRFLKKVIDNSFVVKIDKSGNVGIGSTVTLNSGDKDITYSIVGDHETDPMRGKVSYRSPIGIAIIGKKPGDYIEVILPKGTRKYLVVKID